MPNVPPKPEKIEDIGLEQHLNNTKEQHNGLDYANFVKMVEDGVDKANLARAFGVSRYTIYQWFELHETEGSNA